MNYLMIFLGLVLAGSVQAQTCNTHIIPDTPVSRFKLNDNNGTVFDKKTALTWMRCALGQTWNSAAKTCNGAQTDYFWPDALSAAEASKFAGFSDWRLPNNKELFSIAETRCQSPTINLTVFPGTPSVAFWSASPHANNPGVLWLVYFDVGYLTEFTGGMLNAHAVRLVRGGQ